jgi:hypothetical protein
VPLLLSSSCRATTLSLPRLIESGEIALPLTKGWPMHYAYIEEWEPPMQAGPYRMGTDARSLRKDLRPAVAGSARHLLRRRGH